MFKEFQLPNGKMATCTADVDRYLKESDTAPASDFSEYYKNNVRYQREKESKDKSFAFFIQQYKKRIWNE